MFEAKSMLFLTVETPLHAGTGRGLGTVDLPIQRERTTGYPMVQASSLKGRLRAHYRSAWTKDDLATVFGPESNDNPSEHAGALAVGDARILLFPVRSLAGVFAWVTSRDALARFLRDAELAGISTGISLPQTEPSKDKAWASSDTIVAGNEQNKRIVLEEFSFTPENNKVAAIAEKLSELVFPMSYDVYWKKSLQDKFCILPQDAFRDFALYGTEVQTHIALDPEKKVVKEGALWTSESLPVDTVLYAPLMATRSRLKKNDIDANTILGKITGDTTLTRINLGGDETTGQGIVGLKFGG